MGDHDDSGAPQKADNTAVSFSIETIALGEGNYVVAVSGEADLYTAPELTRELLRLTNEDTQRVVVDLSQTSFLDSTMLSVLLAAGKRLRPIGGRLDIVCSDPSTRRIFSVTLLDSLFTMFETRQQALDERLL